MLQSFQGNEITPGTLAEDGMSRGDLIDQRRVLLFNFLERGHQSGRLKPI
jgi:hypothetical protein